MWRRATALAALLLALAGCGGTAEEAREKAVVYPPGVEDPPEPREVYYDHDTLVGPDRVFDLTVDPSILESRMLILPGKFRRELENAGRQPFALVTIEGSGNSVEADTESQWSEQEHGGKQVGMLRADWTPPAPLSGNVVLERNRGLPSDPDWNNVGFSYMKNEYSAVNVLSGDWDDLNAPESDATQLRFQTDSQNGEYLGEPESLPLPAGLKIRYVWQRIRARTQNNNTGGDYQPALIIGGTRYTNHDGGHSGLVNVNPGNPVPIQGTSWLDGYVRWETDPSTGLAWTVEGIEAIEAFGMWDVDTIILGGYPEQLWFSVAKLDVEAWYFTPNGHVTTFFDLTGANTESDVNVEISQTVPAGASIGHELIPVDSISVMRPTNHYDVTNETVDEANAYDGDDQTRATCNPVNKNGPVFYLGRDSGNVDSWEAEPAGIDMATLYVIFETDSTNYVAGETLALEIRESDGTLVATIHEQNIWEGISKVTLGYDVSAFIGDLADLRVAVSSESGVGDMTAYVYDAWISCIEYGTGPVRAITDGSSVPSSGYDQFIVKSSMTGDLAVSPILGRVALTMPDNVYRYSTLKEDWFGALPKLNAIPGRTIRLNPENFITEGSSLELSLTDLPLMLETILRDEYIKGMPVTIDFGFWAPDMTPSDLTPYYQGVVEDYKVSEELATFQLRDASKSLKRKLPETPPGEGPAGVLEYDGLHMVDVVQDLIDRSGVLPRFVDLESFANTKADMGVGVGDPDPADFIVYRTDDLVGAGGPDTSIKRPQPANKHVKELLELIGAYLVTQEDGRLQMILYDAADPSVDDWHEGVDIRQGSSFDARLEETLKNVAVVYYDWDGDGSENADFGGIYVVDDADSVLAWGQVNKIIETKWLAQEPAAGNIYNGRALSGFIAAREADRLKNGVGTYTCTTRLDKLEIQVGDMVTIYHDLIVSKNNQVPGAGAKMLVVKKTWAIDSGVISWELVEAT